jgi:hypothetical protein
VRVVERKVWSKEMTCRDCGSRLEVFPEDIEAGMFGTMGDYDFEYYFKCEVCKAENNLGSYPRGVPSHVLEQAAERHHAKRGSR